MALYLGSQTELIMRYLLDSRNFDTVEKCVYNQASGVTLDNASPPRANAFAQPLFVRLSTMFAVLALLNVISAAGAFTLTRFVAELLSMADHAVTLQSRLHALSVQSASNGAGLPDAAREFDRLLDDARFASLRSRNDDYAPARALRNLSETWVSEARPALVLAGPPARNAGPALEHVMAQVDRLIDLLAEDVAIKQSAMLWLQLACVALAISAAALGVHYGWTRLVRGLGRLTARLPLHGSYAPGDEIDKLARAVDVLLVDGARAAEDVVELQRELRAGLSRRSLEALFGINELLTDLPVGEAALLRVLGELERAVGVPASAIHLTDSARAQFGGSATIVSGDARLDSDQLRAFERSGACRVGSYDDCDGLGEARAPARRVRALTAPLKHADQTLGILVLEAGTDFDFDEWQIRLVELVSRQIAAAIGNASLGYESRRVALLEERAAIARELHDSIAQSLSYMKIQISRLESMLNGRKPAEQIHAVIEELREGLNGAYRKLRELLTTFRITLSAQGLAEALDETIAEFANRGGLALTLDNRLGDCSLNSNEEVHILQIIREALSNVVRHAHASRAVIALDYDRTHLVTVSVEDDGVGLHEPANPKYHHGTVIMQERVSSLGGTLAIEAREEGGTRVRFCFAPAMLPPHQLRPKRGMTWTQ